MLIHVDSIKTLILIHNPSNNLYRIPFIVIYHLSTNASANEHNDGSGWHDPLDDHIPLQTGVVLFSIIISVHLSLFLFGIPEATKICGLTRFQGVFRLLQIQVRNIKHVYLCTVLTA